MKPPANLIGQTFSQLNVMSLSHRTESGHFFWLCVCTCGNQHIASTSALRSGAIKSCGCYNDWLKRNRRPPMEDQFWAKVIRKGAEECWEWAGRRERRGYGRMKYKGIKKIAHRVSWEIAHPEDAPLSPDVLICHRCDNPPCCNPSHLFKGTQLENMSDKMAKGRHVTICAISQETVDEIRRLGKTGMRHREIGEIVKVSQGHVSAIIRGKARASVATHHPEKVPRRAFPHT